MFALYSFQMFSYAYELLHFIRENTHDGNIISSYMIVSDRIFKEINVLKDAKPLKT